MEIGRWCFPSPHFMTLSPFPACSPTWTDSRNQLSSTGEQRQRRLLRKAEKRFLRGLDRFLLHGKTFPLPLKGGGEARAET